MKAPTLPLLLNTWVQIPSISCLNYAVASYLEVLSRVVFYKMQFLSCQFSVRNPPASLHPEPKLSQYPTWSVALRPWLLLCSPLLCCAVLRHFSCVWLFATAWTVALPNPRLLCPWGFYSQEYWSGLPCLPPGDLPNPVIEPRSSALQVDSLPPSHQGSPRILEWVAYRFSSGSSQPRDQAQVSSLQADASPAEAPGKPEVHIKGVISVDPDFCLPIQRKVLNFLTWQIWFPLINNNLLMFQPTYPLW